MLIKLKGLISAADLKFLYFYTTSTLEVLAVFITFLSLFTHESNNLSTFRL